MKSSSVKIEPRRRSYLRLIGELESQLHKAYEEEHGTSGLTFADIARKLGCHKSFITRKMNGTSNMTLETLADLVFALRRRITIQMVETEAEDGNHMGINAVPETASDYAPGSVTVSYAHANESHATAPEEVAAVYKVSI